MTNFLNSSLDLLLLIELVQTIIRTAVLIYTAFLNPDATLVTTITYILYSLLVVSLLYVYSYIGEQMTDESMKVTEAYFDIEWHRLSHYNQKLMLIAVCAGQRTLYVTAGKVYRFSLSGFIQIMKTCFGYVSLLQTL
ncbi:hypothetical protein ANTQUA_LOCUS6406 [Anthophora quadrimaculata]